jgi:hypothetical protein
MNPLLIIAGIAAIYYLPTLIGIVNLDVSVYRIIPVKIESKLIQLDVAVKYINKSSFRINLNRLSADVLLNNRKIGTLNQRYSVSILPGKQRIISNLVELTPENLGDQLWKEAINMNLQNFVLELKGTITANGKSFPYNSQWTFNDIVSGS